MDNTGFDTAIDLVGAVADPRPPRQLRPHQRRGRDWLLSGPGRGLFWKMGAGKTAAVLAAIPRHRARYAGAVWIVGPRLVVDITWPEEIAAWPQFAVRAIRITGDPARRRRQLQQHPEGILLMGYEQMVWAAHEVQEGRVVAPSLVVFDEASALRNPNSLRWKAAVFVGARAQARWLLTGSPLGSMGLAGAWGLVTLMDLGATWGSSYGRWLERHFTHDDVRRRWVAHEGTDALVHAAMAPLAQSLNEADYPQIPSQTMSVWVELPDKALRIYQDLAAGLRESLRSTGVEIGSLDALLSPLRQAAGGAIYQEIGSQDWRRLHDAKLDRLAELLEEAGNSLVYCAFRHEVARLQQRWPQAPVLAGGVDRRMAQRIVQEWIAGEHPFVIAHPAVGGYGLNLAAGGSSVIWHTLPLSLEHFEQGNARLVRPGQRRLVTISLLLARDTIDVAIARLVHQRAVVDKSLLRELSPQAASECH